MKVAQYIDIMLDIKSIYHYQRNQSFMKLYFRIHTIEKGEVQN